MNQTNDPYESTPEHFRSSWPAHRAAPRSRRYRAIRPHPLRIAAIALIPLLGFTSTRATAATPVPAASAKARQPVRIDVTKIQPRSLLPKRREHQEYDVEINRLGQVARVRKERGNGDPTFNAQTYGNALQTFIRTPDGHVVLGTYRLTYDFDPKTSRVRRDVTLLRQGGVNPDAQSAVADLLSKIHPHTPLPGEPTPASAIDPRNLPDLPAQTPPTPRPSPR